VCPTSVIPSWSVSRVFGEEEVEDGDVGGTEVPEKESHRTEWGTGGFFSRNPPSHVLPLNHSPVRVVGDDLVQYFWFRRRGPVRLQFPLVMWEVCYEGGSGCCWFKGN